MKKFFFLVILFISYSGLHAQSQPDTNLFADSRALQFQIGSNFSLAAFDGATISYKMNVSPYEAWRIGISINTQTTYKGENAGYTGGGAGVLPELPNSREYVFSFVSAYFLKYAPAKKYVYFYYGGGPVLGVSYQRYKYGYYYQNGGIVEEKHESKSNSYSVGLGGVCGAEIFVVKGVSLSAEYQGTALYGYSKTSRTDNNNMYVYDNEHSFQFSSDVRMGLSIYF